MAKVKRNPTKAKSILKGPSQSRRRRVWAGKKNKKIKKTNLVKKGRKILSAISQKSVKRKLILFKKNKKFKSKSIKPKNKKVKTKKLKAKIRLKTTLSRGGKKKKIKKAVLKKRIKIRLVSKKPAKKIKVAAVLPKTEKPKTKPEIAKTKSAEFSDNSFFKAKIKVVGIGGGGGSIVSEIGKFLEKASFVIADTDLRALKKRPGIKYLWFGGELTRGLGTGINVELGRQAAEEAREKISPLFKDQDIVIFIASLGGGLGSGATQIFIQEAKKYGAITFGIFTLPFKFEGRNKARIAQTALKFLRPSLNVFLTIPNEKIFKIINESTPIINAFSVVNKNLADSLKSLIDLIYNPGIINIDFADLRTILKGRGNLAFLNTIEESGKNRADKICERTFVNPLLQNNYFTAEKILFNISGSDNLSMFEVEKISSHIAKSNPNAKIIFGISKNTRLKNKIKITVLMTGGGVKIESETKKTELAETKFLTSNSKIQKKKKRKRIAMDSEKSEAEETKKKLPLIAPVFNMPPVAIGTAEQKKMNVVETASFPAKKTIRRSGVEIKKAEELEEKKRIAQEKEWEIPAFLRRVKFNK